MTALILRYQNHKSLLYNLINTDELTDSLALFMYEVLLPYLLEDILVSTTLSVSCLTSTLSLTGIKGLDIFVSSTQKMLYIALSIQ